MSTLTKLWADTPTYVADNPANVSRVEHLVARDLRVCECPFEVYFAEVSTASAVEVVLATISIYVPDYAHGIYLFIVPEARVSAGTGFYRLRDGTKATAGGPVSVGNTVYAEKENSVPIGSDDTDSVHSIEIIGRASGGTLFLRSINRMAAFFLEQ